jgi:hypothetical protein
VSELDDIYAEELPDDATRKVLRAEQAKAAAQRETRHTKALLQEAEEELDRAHHELALYDREWKAQPKWLSAGPRRKPEQRGTLVSILSDTHYGEIVDPAEMGGYNAYNLDIAKLRTKRYFEKLVELPEQYLAGIKYDGIVLALGGDIVSGDIHDELTETNEVGIYETVETVLPWLVEGITLLHSYYTSVHVVSAPGNHGRRTRKPHAKRFSADNADTHIARLLAQSITAKPVTFNIPRAMDASFGVYSTRFSLEHGQSFRGGDGQVGALGPIKRGVLRKKQQAQAEGSPFDVLLLGHFHQLVTAPGQGFIANGSVVGFAEYARGAHFAPEAAQQALFLVSPEHGVQAHMPVIVSDRSGEGW